MIILILSVMLSSCETGITESIINTDPVNPAQTSTDVTVSNMIRIQVDETMAEKFVASCDVDGYVSADVLRSEGFDVDGLQVRTTFMIGGKYLERQKKAGLDRWFDVITDSAAVATKAVVSIPGVEYSEAVYIPVRTDQMNDPKSTVQWQFNNVGNYGFKKDVDIRLNEAWDIYGKYGKDNVIVAIVDSGVDILHEDLNANVWVNKAEAEGSEGVDDDGNGYVDDIYGYNFINNSPDIIPDDHGTHIAGVISAVNDNGIGVSSIAGGRYPDKGVNIMSLQAIDSNSSTDILKVFQYAADNGAVICQNSWVYTTATTVPQVAKVAIDYFTEYAGTDEFGNQVGPMKGGLVIFAAGNDARDYGIPGMYDGCLSVAAVGPTGKYAYYTCYGDWVDVSAPGGDQQFDAIRGGVYSTLAGNKYGGLQGTSMACPHVSGLAALLVSEFGKEGFTSADLRRIIEDSCDPSIYDYNKSMEGKLGRGMIDVVRAIASFSETAPDAVSDHTCEIKSNTANFDICVPADADDSLAYIINIDVAKVGASATRYEYMVSDYEIDSLGRAVYTVKGLEFETDYTYTMSAQDYAGNISPATAPAGFKTGGNSKPVVTIDSDELMIVNRGSIVTRKVQCVEPDGHDYSVSITSGAPEGGVYYTKNSSTEYTVSVDGYMIPDGDYTFTFTATDIYGASESVSVDFVVGNSAPELLKPIPDVYINGIDEVKVLKFNDYFFDEDGETLSESFKMNGKDVIKIARKNDNIVITSLSAGSVQVTTTVSDSAGESVQTSFNVYVRDASKAFDIYPTQTLDVINIRTGVEQEYDVRIYSSTGREVLRKAEIIAMDKVLTLDVSAISPGYYTVKLTAADGAVSKSGFVKL